MKKLYLPVTAKEFQRCFRESGMSLGSLARGCKYRNISKGANRISRYFEKGFVTLALFKKLQEALGISDGEIRRWRQLDDEAWNAWADEPIEPYLVVRVMATVYCPQELEVSTLDEAKKHAAAVARRRQKKTALVWSRRITFYYDQTGKETGFSEARRGQANSPFLLVRGQKVVI